MKIHVAGENSLIVYFGDQVSSEITAQVRQTAQALPSQLGGLLIDLIPSYASLLVIFDPLRTDHLAVRKAIHLAHDSRKGTLVSSSRLIELPVYYAADSGPDLVKLADGARLSVEEVIDIHTSVEYHVHAIGFAPGFAYLGQVDARIATPRLSTPRVRVPKGAVAIADQQTAVYPAVSPGGWNLIGLCPVDMFDPQAEPVMPVSVGDRVKFNPINRSAFLRLGGKL